MGNVFRKSSLTQVGPSTPDRVVPISQQQHEQLLRAGNNTIVLLVMGSGRSGTPLFGGADTSEVDTTFHKHHDIHTKQSLLIQLTMYACCIDGLPYYILDARDNPLDGTADWIDDLPYQPHAIVFKTDLTGYNKINFETNENQMVKSIQSFGSLCQWLLSSKRRLSVVVAFTRKEAFEKELLSNSIPNQEYFRDYPKNYNRSSSRCVARYFAKKFLSCCPSDNDILSAVSYVECCHDIGRSIDSFAREMYLIRLCCSLGSERLSAFLFSVHALPLEDKNFNYRC
mmetsp:Transcript_31739/g.48670  ORF Transcript_31739/g.48670 Transcript_31739/m.48670 type:complete len:284 (-) Transcript_31739:263-1114(-)|eukprot:CAMPEP_0195304378 /NCGR_PEP_ID=MMETSP0707-20130614/34335_1 /TAXON_ID=33640 /ORGANISM="Asterionellopsis glacialis, Strain CCMP134" /LENGTH=283 /DNA_ID=CAMNT_0040368163 /DNA_START=146 /DNA_END=997 /DNA_ORIENTATION=-